ncbi:Pentatricopeptide repeat-containing protein [Hibiscus syriacus]|uniref:Pentatricopeptide repeat-containing protein n=1 Tax=Hibiscus syriacus TaxID=106335 RepID=A0A6A3BZW0_HIBSY|nr:pentatricopeptide repeat-containing protein At5g08510-like [Hibiscus syriacus]KAE8722104.1 Pentatricopeptide repeat-containing protein [Hibiscus syriacus]
MNRLKKSIAYTLKNGLEQHQTELLIIQLIQAPNIPYAHKLFDLTPKKTVFLYNKLIQAYSSVNRSHECLTLYSQMCLNNCSPNEHSFIFLFPACAALSSLSHGQILHTRLLKSGFGLDCYALTALLDMYAKLLMLPSARKLFDEMRVRNVPTWNALISGYSRCGDMNEALELFKSMPEKNVVSWTSMISGYSQNGQFSRALDMFLEMENERGVKPNRVTIASVLPACASLGALEVGERIEAYARENGLFEDLYVSNSILEMHARCGKIEVAKKVFDEIGKRRNLCSWNSMIMALALHGKSIEALEYYDQMLHEGTVPDDVTFVGVLLACTHGGLVTEGQELFESMLRNYNINPKLEHYGCMVDLLGRAGALQEAYDLIKTMPMKPDVVVWGSLLGACSFHNNVELAEKAAQPLFELEPWNAGNYIILSNIYASLGRWDGVAKLRKMMKGGRITKAAGYSFLEEGGEMHKFLVEDKSHPRCDEIYEILHRVSTVMKLQEKLINFESELLMIMEQDI